MVRVFASVFTCLQDSPERRSRNGLQHGNATNAPIFGVAVNLFTVWPVLVPCRVCYQHLIDGTHPTSIHRIGRPSHPMVPTDLKHVCPSGSCTSWCFDERISFPYPENWPSSEKTAGGSLVCMELNFVGLIETCTLTMDRYIMGIGKQTSAELSCSAPLFTNTYRTAS